MEQKKDKTVLKIVCIIVVATILFVLLMVGCGYYLLKSITGNEVFLSSYATIEEIVANDSVPEGEFTELVYTEYIDGEETIITVTDPALIKEVYDLIVGTSVKRDGVDVDMYAAKYVLFSFSNDNGGFEFAFIPYSYYEHFGEHEMNFANADRIKKASDMIVNSEN